MGMPLPEMTYIQVANMNYQILVLIWLSIIASLPAENNENPSPEKAFGEYFDLYIGAPGKEKVVLADIREQPIRLNNYLTIAREMGVPEAPEITRKAFVQFKMMQPKDRKEPIQYQAPLKTIEWNGSVPRILGNKIVTQSIRYHRETINYVSVPEWFVQLDIDHGPCGQIEFWKFRKEYQKRNERYETIQGLFQELDTNGDWILTQSEIKKYLEQKDADITRFNPYPQPKSK